MAALLLLVRVLVPILLRGAADGTLMPIVETALKLIGLLRPLLTDPKTVAAAESLADSLAILRPRPAEPDDPAMARVAPAHKFGGR